MSKYIDADKLITEIKRLIRENEVSDDKEYAQYELDVAGGYDIACDEILSIITSLQQEQLNNNVKEKTISLQIQAYLTTASDELYAPGKPLYTEAHHKGIHECMLMWQKLHQYYFSTMQEQSAEWSKEDTEDNKVLEKIILAFRRIANGCEHYFSPDTAKVFVKTLENIRAEHHYKPTPE